MSSISAGTTSTTTLVHSGDTTGSLVFKTNDTGSGGTTAVTIDTSQNVGIGTASPANILNLKSSTQYKGLRLDNATNIIAELLGFDASNESGGLKLYSSASPKVQLLANGDSYFTGGNLLVGTTSTANAAKVEINFNGSTNNAIVIQTTRAALGSVYELFLNSAGATAGQISQNGTTTVAYTTSSDYRLKENVRPMTGALSVVQQLKPVTYKWKSDGSDGQGFIAHELQSILPDCVVGEKDAVDANGNPVYQGIDTSFLVATLTAAIQELKAINDQQAETINALTARVVALEGK